MSQKTSFRLGDDLRLFANRLERYLRLEAAERLTVMSTFVVWGAIALALSVSAIFFLSTGLVKTVTLWTENEMVSYYIVGAALVLIIVLLFVLRKPLIEKRLVSFYSRKLLDTPNFTDHLMAKDRREESIRQLAKSLAQELGDYDEEGGRL